MCISFISISSKQKDNWKWTNDWFKKRAIKCKNCSSNSFQYCYCSCNVCQRTACSDSACSTSDGTGSVPNRIEPNRIDFCSVWDFQKSLGSGSIRFQTLSVRFRFDSRKMISDLYIFQKSITIGRTTISPTIITRSQLITTSITHVSKWSCREGWIREKIN
jgi:hypothetical protein